MFDSIEFSISAQRSVCLMMSAVIVAASLSLGAYGAQSALHDASYTVTVHY
jgi:hypothetical protein